MPRPFVPQRRLLLATAVLGWLRAAAAETPPTTQPTTPFEYAAHYNTTNGGQLCCLINTDSGFSKGYTCTAGNTEHDIAQWNSNTNCGGAPDFFQAGVGAQVSCQAGFDPDLNSAQYNSAAGCAFTADRQGWTAFTYGGSGGEDGGDDATTVDTTATTSSTTTTAEEQHLEVTTPVAVVTEQLPPRQANTTARRNDTTEESTSEDEDPPDYRLSFPSGRPGACFLRFTGYEEDSDVEPDPQSFSFRCDPVFGGLHFASYGGGDYDSDVEVEFYIDLGRPLEDYFQYVDGGGAAADSDGFEFADGVTFDDLPPLVFFNDDPLEVVMSCGPYNRRANGRPQFLTEAACAATAELVEAAAFEFYFDFEGRDYRDEHDAFTPGSCCLTFPSSFDADDDEDAFTSFGHSCTGGAAADASLNRVNSTPVPFLTVGTYHGSDGCVGDGDVSTDPSAPTAADPRGQETAGCGSYEAARNGDDQWGSRAACLSTYESPAYANAVRAEFASDPAGERPSGCCLVGGSGRDRHGTLFSCSGTGGQGYVRYTYGYDGCVGNPIRDPEYTDNVTVCPEFFDAGQAGCDAYLDAYQAAGGAAGGASLLNQFDAAEYMSSADVIAAEALTREIIDSVGLCCTSFLGRGQAEPTTSVGISCELGYRFGFSGASCDSADWIQTRVATPGTCGGLARYPVVCNDPSDDQFEEEVSEYGDASGSGAGCLSAGFRYDTLYDYTVRCGVDPTTGFPRFPADAPDYSNNCTVVSFLNVPCTDEQLDDEGHACFVSQAAGGAAGGAAAGAAAGAALAWAWAGC